MCKNPRVPVFVEVCAAGLGLEQCPREWVVPGGICAGAARNGLRVHEPHGTPQQVCGHPSSDLSQGSYRGSLRASVTPSPYLCWAPLCPQEALPGVLHIVLGSGPIASAPLEGPPRCDQPSAVQITHREPDISPILSSPLWLHLTAHQIPCHVLRGAGRCPWLS